MIAFVSALAVFALCALTIVLVSRANRTVAPVLALGAYACAFLVIEAFGVRAVATAWVAMAAAMAAIYAMSGTAAAGERRTGLVPRTIASFVVGLLGWPFVFPGIRVSNTGSVTPTPSAPVAANAGVPSAAAPSEDDDDAPARVRQARGTTLADVPGAATVSISGGYVLARATLAASAELRAPGSAPATWLEDRAASFAIANVAGGIGTVDALDTPGGIVSGIAVDGSQTFSRDRWYEIGSAFGRAYAGAVRVDDSLEGLGA